MGTFNGPIDWVIRIIRTTGAKKMGPLDLVGGAGVMAARVEDRGESSGCTLRSLTARLAVILGLVGLWGLALDVVLVLTRVPDEGGVGDVTELRLRRHHMPRGSQHQYAWSPVCISCQGPMWVSMCEWHFSSFHLLSIRGHHLVVSASHAGRTWRTAQRCISCG